jgi:hypothetical protein
MRAVFGRRGSPDVFLYAFDVLEMDAMLIALSKRTGSKITVTTARAFRRRE